MSGEPEFGGVIGRDFSDSEPWWPPEREPPAERAQRAVHRARRRRLRAARLLRLRHRDPQHRPARGRRRAALELPHHRALLADALVPAHRPQPPQQRHGPGRRPRVRLPRLLGRHPPRERLPLRDPPRRRATRRTRSASGTSRPTTRRTWRRSRARGRSAAASTAGTGSTAARRTSSCPRSTTTTTRSSRRARSTRATTSAPTSPTARSSSSPTSATSTTSSRFFLYFATGACHSPHHAPPDWIARYHGQFDDGWDAWRERTHARQLDDGHHPAGHRALAAAGVGARVGRRCTSPTRRSRRGSWSASPRSSRTPTRRSAGCSTSSSRSGDLDDTHDRARVRQRRELRRRRARLDQRRPARGTATPPGARSCATASTSSAGRRCTTTIRGAGRWPATRRSSAGSARCTRAASPIRASCAGRGASRTRRGGDPPSVRARDRRLPDRARARRARARPRDRRGRAAPDRRRELRVPPARRRRRRARAARHAVLRDARLPRRSTTGAGRR